MSEEQPRLKAEGINIVAWGQDPQTGRERLTVQDLTAATTATLQHAFGADNIILVSTPHPTVACGCPASAVSPGSRSGHPPQTASPTN